MPTCVTRIRRVMDERLRVYGVSVARKRVLGCPTDGPVRQAGLAATKSARVAASLWFPLRRAPGRRRDA
ncbi:hypothetical protein AB0912_18120 [Streptomyces sp. NPDC007084]|uniref:hypothetical protein n=1 Tax=Streptomyces sp. NPDC007084 TaxID=3154313 RepID=UPI0034532FFE